MNVGLISGINYVDLVKQLIKIDGIPMDNLSARTDRLQLEKNALSELMSRFLLSSYMIRNLNSASPYKRTEVSSSNPNLITVVKSGTPVVGSYTFTPLQMASSQQTVAKGVASDTDPLGKTGTITIGKGWTVENEVKLADINGGEGFSKGSIRITDADGNRATVDLRKALTVKDVINAINDNGNADVIAELDGDRIVLRDLSGGTGTMNVMEVSGGTTAASLGLIGAGVATDNDGVRRGNTIWRLGENMSLSLLNDGNGLVFDNISYDFTVQCRDGTSVSIDFNRLTSASEQAAGAPINMKEITVGDLLNTINKGGNGKVTARISDDGKKLVLEDHTTGNNVTSLVAGSSANPILRMLGFSNGDSGYINPLLGLASPPYMEVTDKAGNTAVIEPNYTSLLTSTNANLTSIAGILNSALVGSGVNIEFRVNANRDGLDVVDKSGGTGTVTIADYGNSDLASRLKLTSSGEVDMVPALAGVTPGTIRFTDTLGNSAEITLSQSELATVKTAEALKDLFNDKLIAAGSTVGIVIDVNGAGTALTLTDTTNGTERATQVTDVGGNLASRLGLTLNSGTHSADVTALLAGVTPGQIEFTDKSGFTATIEIDQPEIDGITSLADLVTLFNAKFEEEGLGINAIINNAYNGIRFNNAVSGGTVAMEIADVGTGNLAALLGVDGASESTVWVFNFADITPGEVRLVDKDGTEAIIDVTQGDLDAITTLADIVAMFTDKLTASGTGIGIDVELNLAGTRLVFKDATGGTEPLIIESVDPLNGTNITTRLYIPSSTTGDEAMSNYNLVYHRIEGDAILENTFQSVVIEEIPVTQGSAFSGVIESRNLLGGLDTVLVSSLNGGFGLNGTKPGLIEVQDRAGNRAELQITSTDLKAMQTLSDAVKIFNQKISDAGLGVTVRINETKTGLEVVDTTGSSASNLIFRDKTTTTTIPGTPGIPAVPAVDALSADNGTGGTAQLTFQGTHWMNGFTFSFTTVAGDEGYDGTSSVQKFTVLLTQDILDELDPAERDRMVKEAIDNLIEAEWGTGSLSAFSGVEPPKVKLTSGLGDQAIDDATTGGETAIKTTVPGAVMGVTHVPAVPAGPDTVVSDDPKIASAFGLNFNATSSKVSGTSLNRQTVSHNTLLSEWNNGQGVQMLGGRIVITDSRMITGSDGKQTANSYTIHMDPKQHQTVGDLINSINRISGLSVIASINATGDGIEFREYAGGTGLFSIYDADSTSKFAASMGIAGMVPAAQADADGNRFIRASETHQIEVVATDSLDDIRKKINDLNKGFSASIIMDGSSTPYRLSISGTQTGKAGGFNIDLSAIGLTTENMSEAKDAMIAYGDNNSSTGLILSSSTNTFKGVINGMDLTITGVSDTPVTISSANSNMDVKVSLQMFVDNYNNFREYLNQQMSFTVSATRGVLVSENGGYLWNSSIAKAFDREVSTLLLKAVTGIPGIRSLADLGISMRSNYGDVEEGIGVNSQTGKLNFDEDKFQEAWDRDPDAVQKFFFDEKKYTDSSGKETTVNYGWAQKFSDLTDSLVGRADTLGKVQARIDALTENIDRNEQRIASMQARLDWKEQYYLKQFYAMEQAMAKMTKDMSAVSNISNAWQTNYSGGQG